MAWLDCDLDGATDRELIEELECRSLSDDMKQWLLEIIKSDNNEISVILKAMDKFPLWELRERLNEDAPIIVSNDNRQLALPL